jgi:hypothetical protein
MNKEDEAIAKEVVDSILHNISSDGITSIVTYLTQFGSMTICEEEFH